MNQLGQATGANPEAFSPLAAGEQHPSLLASSTEVAGLLDVKLASSLSLDFGRALIERNRFSHLNRERSGGADPNAKASTIAQLFTHYLGLAVNHDDGPFSTRRDACAATVAQFLVDTYNLPRYLGLFRNNKKI
jgi:hypothetical protein